MTRFKKGDKVRCVEACISLTKGKVYEVQAVKALNTRVFVRDDNGASMPYETRRFELVKPADPDDAINPLIDKANAGFAALRELRASHGTEVEMNDGEGCVYYPLVKGDPSFRPKVRRKPKPALDAAHANAEAPTDEEIERLSEEWAERDSSPGIGGRDEMYEFILSLRSTAYASGYRAALKRIRGEG